MVSKRSSKKSKSRAAEFVQKPRGVIHPRVQHVGPEHFGIVSVDCAKARSKWMLTDFYGRVLVPPTEIAHNRVELAGAVAQVRNALTQRDLHHAAAWIPIKEHAAEAEPLAARSSATRAGRKKGPQPLAEILVIVLARLGVGMLPSKPSEEKDLT